MRLQAVVLAVGALSGSVLAQGQAVNCAGKLSESKVEALLSGGVAQPRVEQIARTCGIDFEVTPAVASRLRQAGAGSGLIGALREIQPKRPETVVKQETPPPRPDKPVEKPKETSPPPPEQSKTTASESITRLATLLTYKNQLAAVKGPCSLAISIGADPPRQTQQMFLYLVDPTKLRLVSNGEFRFLSVSWATDVTTTTGGLYMVDPSIAEEAFNVMSQLVQACRR